MGRRRYETILVACWAALSRMNKDDKRDFIMFEGWDLRIFSERLCRLKLPGQQEYDWERQIGLKMKEIAPLHLETQLVSGGDNWVYIT